MLAIDDRIAVRPVEAWDACHVAPPPDLRVQRVASRGIKAFHAAWADLAARSLEGNIFLDPSFAVPLMQHVRPDRRPDVLLVWEPDGTMLHRRLIGLCPIAVPRVSLLAPARGFADNQASLGTPLLDRERGQAAFAAMLDWLARRPLGPRALVLSAVPADGPFMRLVIGALAPARWTVLTSQSRAVLRPARPDTSNVLSLRSAKTRKERKRQRRRLAEQGVRAYVSARTPADVTHATERFLLLEHKGWKGVRGTALLADTALATFVRTMTRDMSREGKCRIDTLEIDGRAVAMGIVLTARGTAHFWKTAFDEDLARLSPGVQFTADLAEVQLGEPGVTMTDSCAIQNHPMIDGVWPDRLAVIDIAIAVRDGGSLGLDLGLALERARRTARAWAKAGWVWWKKHRGAR